MATTRLQAVDPGAREHGELPTWDQLPHFKEYPGCAWGLWGEDDELGTVNLLTPDVVQRAAKEVRLGKAISLNWPLNFPGKPFFDRNAAIHTITPSRRGPWESTPNRNDELQFNTQSSTHWNGMLHWGVIKYKVYYNNTPADTSALGVRVITPHNIGAHNIKLGTHSWAEHGICGRGVLLDLVRHFSTAEGGLAYDPWSSHGISAADLEACAKVQGVAFRTGDILLLRVGFIKKYNESTPEERAGRPDTAFAGLEPSEEICRFLWNNHFAAVASDQPALERLPFPEDATQSLHQQILGLWGMPLGEMFDLEALSEVCAEAGRYTFFFSSWPLNVLGGIASPANAGVYL